MCGLSKLIARTRSGQLVVLSLADREGDRARLQPLVRDLGRSLLGDQLDATQTELVEAIRRMQRVIPKD